MRGRNVSFLVQGTEQTQILASHRHSLWRTNDVFMYQRVVSGFFYVQLHSMSKLKHHAYPEVEDFEHLHLANVCLSDDYETYGFYTIIIRKKHSTCTHNDLEDGNHGH